MKNENTLQKRLKVDISKLPAEQKRTTEANHSRPKPNDPCDTPVRTGLPIKGAGRRFFQGGPWKEER